VAVAVDAEQLVRHIAVLRRAERAGAPAAVADVRRDLERAVGRTVRRAVAARLLGITQTALDRLIAADRMPELITSTGRREMPLGELVSLLMDVDDLRAAGAGGHAVSTALRAREAAAAATIVVDDALLAEAGSADDRRRAELVSIAYHQQVAARLDDALVARAARRVGEWAGAGRIDEQAARAWRSALALPHAQLAPLITADDEASRTLRHTSPFAGALNHAERRHLRARLAAAETRAQPVSRAGD
jgi:hypothetical protein